MSVKTLMGRRGAGLLALAGALAALLALQGQAAGAPTCTINWTGPAGGNWSVASNWTVVSGGSHRVPLGNDNVCVTAGGAAVVVDSNQTVGSLIVGTAGATPDQKVTVSGSNVQLFASDFFIEGTGVVELGAGGGGSYTALNGGNVTNNGTLRSVAGTGWRAVWSSLVNNGTFTVAADTHLDGSSKTYTNAGTITVADAIPVTFAGNTLTQKDGATLTNDGEITGPDSTLRLEGGQLNGANPIELSGTATLQYAADATETVPGEVDVVGNTTTVKGDVPTGSTLRLLARDDLAVANFAAVTTESSVTNRGTIVLDSAANGDYPRLQGLKMVNAGTISLVKGTPGGDRHRYLSSQLDNQGTLTASGDVQALYGSTQSLTNEGTFTVGSSASLSLSTSSTLDQRGTLAVNGSFVTDADDTLRIASTATSASGTLEMHGGTLEYALSSNAHLPLTITLPGASPATSVKGDVPADSTLKIDGRDNLSTATFVAKGSETSVTNRGTIVLDSESNGYYPRLNGLPLVNEGTIQTVKTGDVSPERYIDSPLQNNGTLDVGAGSDTQVQTLSNLSGTTLTAGEYDVAGRLRLTTGLPSIEDNEALVTLRGQGAITRSDGTTSALTGLTTNGPAGALVLDQHSLSLAGPLTNAGGVVVGTGSALGVAGDYVQTGGRTTLADTGRLDPSGKTDVQGGRLDGTGTVGSDLDNAGVVVPGTGTGTVAAGTLHVTGAYAQKPAGELKTQVDDATHASDLQVDGNSDLGGTLTITRKAGYTPAVGDAADIAGGGGMTGAFATTNVGTSHPRYVVGYTPAAGAAITWADVPGAPRNVLATAGNKTATVNWTAAADNAGAVTGYTVRAHPSDSSGDVVQAVGAAVRSTSLTGLTNGKAYDVTVTAANTLGAGAASAAATVDPANASPPAAFTVSPASPEAGRQVTVTSTATDADGTVAATAWDLDDDGAYDDGTATTATVTFATAGDRTIRVRVTDDDGAAATTAKTVTVKAAPVADTGGGSGGGDKGPAQQPTQTTTPTRPATQTTTPAQPKAAVTSVLADVISGLTQAGTTGLASGVLTDVVAKEPGTCKVEVLVKKVVLASGSKKFAAPGKGRVRIRATAKGRSVLKRAKTLKVTIRATCTPVGGKPAASERKLTLKARKKTKKH